MSKLLVRKDLQDQLRSNVGDMIKQIESTDLKVVVYMEHTEQSPRVLPKVIKFKQVLPLLAKLADEGQVEEGVAKVMFYSPSTGRSRGLTPNMMAGFQYIKPGMSTKPHSHNMASIYIVVKGEGYSVIDGREFRWEQGDVFVVPANSEHSHTNTGTEEVILFDVTDSGLLENMGILEFRESE
ncbi:cupin domain-containing protein [Metallosphaera tengchongensis]|uniref:Cupin domain-containing protein n=1 Tax=Metallosphaera tengchongensis TaxID=1532350 RepID=A0A6N0NSF0_9CREN|nr:cupin domain-containing protein [Metallosphaera tengchongensis]QKQ99631.1 cupin domain-containing protein [Metallosphaera tengchongensis]